MTPISSIISSLALAAALLPGAPEPFDIAPGTVDARAQFRTIFCAVSARMEPAANGGRCDDDLWHLPDEPLADVSPGAPGAVDPRLHLLIVGGAFSDCFPPASTPFVEAAGRLRDQGLIVEYAGVSGRSSSEFNARLIAAQILAMPAANSGPLVLVGYSKGTTDILEMLTGSPEAAARVAAVISVAGAVRGSPLMDHIAALYDRMLRQRSLGRCPLGDGGVLDSLVQARRIEWLANNPLSPGIRYYSVGAFTVPHHLARALVYPQRQLAKIDPRNDGQLLAQDEVIPGSTLLGFVNADHWAVALRIEDAFPRLAHRPIGRHPFPQDALLESILLFVQLDLQTVGASR